jgi:cell division protein FtsI (penicillin-binding protein 3)
MIGEGLPKIKDPTDPSWSGITLPWMSIGYELQLTPLQLLAFYNAVANDGQLVTPIIVKRIRKAERIVEEYEAEVMVRSICSKSTVKRVQALLEGVVENGTASNIKNPYYKIAGKTGTAQKIENGRYTKKYYTSFAGYFPADHPKYSCIVVIDAPKGFKQYGSNVAAPVFKEIADKIYSKDLDIHQPVTIEQESGEGVFPVIRAGKQEDLTKICTELKIPFKSTVDDEWVRARLKDNAVLWTTDEIAPGVMPNVTGMTLRDAIFILENRGVSVRHTGRGRVKTQSITPGTKIKNGTSIALKLG